MLVGGLRSTVADDEIAIGSIQVVIRQIIDVVQHDKEEPPLLEHETLGK